VSRALAEAESALGDNGRVVLRYSGTEPLARVMVEAGTMRMLQRYSQSLAEALRESIGADRSIRLLESACHIDVTAVSLPKNGWEPVPPVGFCR